MGIRGLKVFGDAVLIIQQVNKTFQAKHPRLKAYRDEKLFNHNDVPYKPAKTENDSIICKHNIGSPTHLKLISLSTNLTFAQNFKYCALIKQFADIFVREYSDHKTYDTNIIPHKIPLGKNTTPFKQKLRPISPLLLPLIEKEIKNMLEDNKNSWDSKLKFALSTDRVTIKNSIGNSPFKLVYGADVVFPVQLILPVAKFLQEEQDEENDMVRRMNNLVEL
eukprot:PITA_32038